MEINLSIWTSTQQSFHTTAPPNHNHIKILVLSPKIGSEFSNVTGLPWSQNQINNCKSSQEVFSFFNGQETFLCRQRQLKV